MGSAPPGGTDREGNGPAVPSLGFFCYALWAGLFLAVAVMGALWVLILILANLPAQF